MPSATELETELAERVKAIDAQVELLDAERDWLETKLAERVEVIEAQVELLDAERDRLEAKLAERVKAIDAQVELLDAERTRLETEPSVGQSRSPGTVRLRQEREAAPIASGKAAPIAWGRRRAPRRFLVAPGSSSERSSLSRGCCSPSSEPKQRKGDEPRIRPTQLQGS